MQPVLYNVCTVQSIHIIQYSTLRPKLTLILLWTTCCHALCSAVRVGFCAQGWSTCRWRAVLVSNDSHQFSLISRYNLFLTPSQQPIINRSISCIMISVYMIILFSFWRGVGVVDPCIRWRKLVNVNATCDLCQHCTICPYNYIIIILYTTLAQTCNFITEALVHVLAI